MIYLAPDGLPDDRAACEACRHCVNSDSYCRKYRMAVIPRLPLRCIGFDPVATVADRRTGAQRWPNLLEAIADARAADARAIDNPKG